MNERKIVEVGAWMTKCGVCGENVLDGTDNTHKVAGGGWGAEPEKPGCGVVWTHVSAGGYVGVGIEERVKSMYPGLEFL